MLERLTPGHMIAEYRMDELNSAFDVEVSRQYDIAVLRRRKLHDSIEKGDTVEGRIASHKSWNNNSILSC